MLRRHASVDQVEGDEKDSARNTTYNLADGVSFMDRVVMFKAKPGEGDQPQAKSEENGRNGGSVHRVAAIQSPRADEQNDSKEDPVHGWVCQKASPDKREDTERKPDYEAVNGAQKARKSPYLV
jgi:hypothetical protein